MNNWKQSVGQFVVNACIFAIIMAIGNLLYALPEMSIVMESARNASTKQQAAMDFAMLGGAVLLCSAVATAASAIGMFTLMLMRSLQKSVVHEEESGGRQVA